MNDQGNCSACGHAIDAMAKVCPYCGGNPSTGERADTQAMLQEVFRPRELTRSESVLEYARQRQTAVVAISIIAGFLLLAALHQFVTMRNEQTADDSPAVPLTEITDVSRRGQEEPQPMPDLEFQYDGRPRAMQTWIVEPGAAAPPPQPPAPAALPSAAPKRALPAPPTR